jgi:hypothetical protein
MLAIISKLNKDLGRKTLYVLLNIIVDVLANMIPKGKEVDQVEGAISHLVDGGVSILQYAMILLFLWSMIFKKILI